MLTDLGFEGTTITDAVRKKLTRALRRFAEEADVALVYYSCHGIEAGGENFLVPVDAGVGSLAEADELVPSPSSWGNCRNQCRSPSFCSTPAAAAAWHRAVEGS